MALRWQNLELVERVVAVMNEKRKPDAAVLDEDEDDGDSVAATSLRQRCRIAPPVTSEELLLAALA